MFKCFLAICLSLTLFVSCKGVSDGNAPSLGSVIGSSVAISPETATMVVSTTKSYSASGGTSPYTYSILSGPGSIDSATGVYTAAATSGSAIIRVTDSIGITADAIITVVAQLQISPTSVTIVPSSSVQLTVSGGVAPISYAIMSGSGSVGTSTGNYTASVTEGPVVVRATDSMGNTSDATITVSSALALTPSSGIYITTGGAMVFTASGGTAPYSFSCTNINSIIDPATGDYEAAPSAGTDTCTVTDNLGATASTTTMNIYSPLAISPTSLTLGVNSTTTFSATGGFGSLSYSVYSGNGTINSVSGFYTAPATAGDVIIRVTDSIGNFSESHVTVVSGLTISPKDIFLPLGSTVNAFTAVLGTAPYSYSVTSGGGSINASSGLYTGDLLAGTGIVTVTDSAMNTNSANVYHITPVDIISNWSYHVCALYSGLIYSNHKLKCWGYNASGQLGLGVSGSVGDSATELGYGLPFVDVGTGRYVKKVATGWHHTCAILDNDQVKCWGQGTYGQLGYGNTSSLGATSATMGDNLAYVDLGTGRTAKEIYAFGYRSCAILDNNALKCWGRNITGQLGQGDVVNRGDNAGEMGDSLIPVDLGTGRYAVKIAGTESTTCALLDNGSLKCWGLGQTATYSGVSYTYYGELGLETNNKTWGDGASEMGDTLPTVNLNIGANSISDIVGGRAFYCALISNGDVKCWGRNNNGQLGKDSTTNIGDTVGSMSSLSAITLGTTAVAIKNMRESACAVLTGGTTKCWGRASKGELLQGNTTKYGSTGFPMSSLNAMNLSTGFTVKKIATGYAFGCAILNDDRVKCWGATSCGTGSVSNGCLLTGSTTSTNIGDVMGEVGDSLSFVNH